MKLGEFNCFLALQNCLERTHTFIYIHVLIYNITSKEITDFCQNSLGHSILSTLN